MQNLVLLTRELFLSNLSSCHSFPKIKLFLKLIIPSLYSYFFYTINPKSGVLLTFFTMTIVVDDNEEIPCSHCLQLRKSFVMIGISAVAPMVFFAGLLLVASAEGLHETPTLGLSTSVIVEFVFGLLHIQLVVATSVLLVSFIKRREPVIKYQYWYILFHVAVMATFICACFVMTGINKSYTMTLMMVCGAGGYMYVIYKYLKVNREIWKSLRRVN